jgi:hypothetical protein
MPETKVPSAGNAVVIYFVNKLERAFDRTEGGYLSGESFFPDSIIKAFDKQNNSLIFTPDFFGKPGDIAIMRFGSLVISVPVENISKILIV